MKTVSDYQVQGNRLLKCFSGRNIEIYRILMTYAVVTRAYHQNRDINIEKVFMYKNSQTFSFILLFALELCAISTNMHIYGTTSMRVIKLFDRSLRF